MFISRLLRLLSCFKFASRRMDALSQPTFSSYLQPALLILSANMEVFLLAPDFGLPSVLSKLLGVWAVTYGAWKYIEAKRSPVGDCSPKRSEFA